MTPPLTTTPADLLREAAEGWEPGPGPFTVPLPVVNKIVNYLAAQPAPPTERSSEAERLLRAIVKADDKLYGGAARTDAIDEARRYLAATEEGR